MNRVVVACHDAGGAEMVSSWLLQTRPMNWAAYLEGPAREVFARKLQRVPKANGLAKTSLIVCGTSKESSFERLVWILGQRSKIRTVAFLDHWKNYRQRFVSGGALALPEELWVTDRYAAEMARREFPGSAVTIKGNPFIDQVVSSVRQIRRESGGIDRVLYVHEPNREREYRRWLRYHFHANQLLRERPHPAMKASDHSLAEDIAWADTVVGCDSMALAAALRVGKKVYSSLLAKEPLTIPFPGIERLHPYRPESR